MSKHVTMKDWVITFDECCDPGDTVDDNIVQHFMNVVPPVVLRIGFIQCGEPYSHVFDARIGKMRATHATFVQTEKSGLWTYCGTCFLGETENRTESGDPWKK